MNLFLNWSNEMAEVKKLPSASGSRQSYYRVGQGDQGNRIIRQEENVK
jgi:hypothetical protein